VAAQTPALRPEPRRALRRELAPPQALEPQQEAEQREAAPEAPAAATEAVVTAAG
jgi:hypothetical protein